MKIFRSRTVRCAQSCIVALFLLLLTALLAEALAQERAHTWNADDPKLEWAPCPEFMPEGCGIAVLQGDPAEPNADVFFRLAPDTTVPMHWHSSAERMILISGQMQVNYEGQAPVVLTPGTYAYGPADLPHETYCEAGEECILFIAFEGPVDAMPTEE